jgi:hypothetical protein
MATQTLFLTGSNTVIDPTLTDYVVTGNTVGSNTVTLGDGNDQFTLDDAGSNKLTLGDGTDSITDSSGSSGGSNTIVIGDGSDTSTDILMLGGASNQITINGSGNNQITTVGGINTIIVGTGSNTITLGDAVSGTPDTVTTGAGGNVVSVSAAAISGDTLHGAQTTSDGTTNQLVLTTAGTMNPVGVYGFATYRLANGGPNSLTLSQANFTNLPGGTITVVGGNSGNTIDAAALAAGQNVTIDAGAGTDVLTGGGGNNRFVFAPSDLTGDTVGGSGNNTVELMAGGAGILTGLGTNFTNITTVVLDANATWTVGISNLAGFTGTVSGFTVTGDVIDLTGLTFVGNTSVGFDPATDVLTVTEGLSSATLQLDAENYTGITWSATVDSGTGTEITVACFCRGTLILTERGEVPVEELAIGDKVVTLSGEAMPIRWIGRRSYQGRFIAGNHAVLPIRVEAGALAEGVPARDLLVSPEHALHIDGVLVPARLLVNGASVVQVEELEQVEYFHIELEAHDIIFAEGAAAESYVDCDNRGMFRNAEEFARLYPGDTRPAWQFCAKRLEEESAELTAVRAALLARAEALGYRLTDDPDLHLIIDGEVVRAQAVAEEVYSFAIPAGSGAIWLASRSAVPAEVEAASRDRRRLGIPVNRIVLRDDDLRTEIGHARSSLRDGFHEDEKGQRWTDGMARLPDELLRPFTGEVTVELHLIKPGLRYPLEPLASATSAKSSASPVAIQATTRRRKRQAS